MKRPEDINNELNELNSSLPQGPGGTPYGVPEGYFEGLAEIVLAKARGQASLSASEEIASISPLLASLSRANPYSIPRGYFESTLENLPALTSDEESLILSFVDKDQPYEAPRGYFAGLPEQVLERVHSRERTIPMTRRKWMRFAAAALVAGILATAGFFYLNRDKASYAESSALAIEKASTEELNAFIRSTDVSLHDEATAQYTPDVQQFLESVPDQELEAFLEQVPLEEDEFDIN